MPAMTREAVAHLRPLLGLSERRACRIAGADRKMVRHQARRAPDTVLRGRLRERANERRRFSYARARAAMMDFRADGGRVLGIKPTVLVVPPELEEDALQLLNATVNDGGGSNVWSSTAELIVTPYVKA